MVSQDTPRASAKPSQTLRTVDFSEISARVGQATEASDDSDESATPCNPRNKIAQVVRPRAEGVEKTADDRLRGSRPTFDQLCRKRLADATLIQL